jgi:hypothetical protein
MLVINFVPVIEIVSVQNALEPKPITMAREEGRPEGTRRIRSNAGRDSLSIAGFHLFNEEFLNLNKSV